MTVLPGKKQPRPHLHDLKDDPFNETPSPEGQDMVHGDQVGVPHSSPHLDSILGKINSIMSESQQDATVQTERKLRGYDADLYENDASKPSPDRSGFQASEPMDLLAPYSEVLNDVRDYFKDRHSLDPSDRLTNAIDPPLRDRSQLNTAPLTGGFDGGAPDRGRQEIFSPVQFEGPITTSLHSSEVMVAEKDEVQVFRRELMGRISQLEQVIGHHFGTQQSVAAEAAKSAVALTLNSLEDTAIGQRLAALETAFDQFKQAQNQLEKHVDPVAPPENPVKGGEQTPEKAPPLPPSPVIGERRALQGGADGTAGDMPVLPEEPVQKADALPPKPDVQVTEPQTAELQKETAPLETPEGIKPGEMPQVLKSPPEAEADDSMQKMRELFHNEADERLFGNRAGDGNPMSAMPGHMAGLYEADEPLDPITAKTAALRAQFRASTIVSNDDEMQAIPKQMARPAFIVISIALLLAAFGIALGDKSFSELAQLKSFINGGIEGDGKGVNPNPMAKELDQKGIKGDKSQAEMKDSSLSGDELSITGNIEPRDLAAKMDNRLSERLRAKDKNGADISPENLLPMATGKLSLPPALIGPYSLRHAAANGDVVSQYEVAQRFALGQGIERNYEEAVRWYMQAAAKGFAPAQYRLGTFYERGRGVERSLERAKIWYLRAAQLGNVKAMHNLAVVNTALNRDKPDYQASIYWFKQAASYNLADSQFNLAILYQNGVGVPKNQVEAYRWFSLAARHGDLEAAKRRDILGQKLKKSDLLLAANMLQAWKPQIMDKKANQVGLKRSHVTSTMSHADETVERSRVLTAQILLRKLGYQVVDADGAMNEKTIAAIKKFEKDKGLPITGKVTPGLLKVLNKAAL